MYKLKKLAVFVFFASFLVLPHFALADYTLSEASIGYDNSTDPNWGYDVNNDAAAQLVTTMGAGSVCTLSIEQKSVGTPLVGAQIDLQSDSGGVPSGVSLGTSDVQTPVGTSGVLTYTFSPCVSLSATTNYWLVFEMASASFNTAFYKNARGALGVTGNSLYHFNGSWTNIGFSDSNFSFCVDTGSGCSGGGPGTTTPWGGYATTTVVVDNPVADLWYGVVLFMCGFFGMIWFFRKQK